MNWLSKLFGKKATDPEDTTMKYLIVGLGNIGEEYAHTRHNVGFEVVDKLAEAFNADFKTEQLGDLTEFRHKGRTFTLLKPSTYMNRSGKAVKFWLQKKKIAQENLLVIVDDLNLPFGKQRLKGKGSDGGHNGLKDIDKQLGNNKYARLRIGIGSDYHKGQQVDFVLGKWDDEEQEKLPEIIDYAVDICKSFGTIGLNHTMNQYNKK